MLIDARRFIISYRNQNSSYNYHDIVYFGSLDLINHNPFEIIKNHNHPSAMGITRDQVYFGSLDSINHNPFEITKNPI